MEDEWPGASTVRSAARAGPVVADNGSPVRPCGFGRGTDSARRGPVLTQTPK